jgi:predicted secreted protein
MADSNAIQAQGTLLKMAADDGVTFTTIGEVRDITGPQLSRKAIDVTPIDATWEQILGSNLARTGSLTFAIGYVPGSATHGFTTGILHKFNSNLKTNFKLIFVNAGEIDFEGYVVKFEDNMKVDGDVQAQIEIKVTGQPTLTAA